MGVTLGLAAAIIYMSFLMVRLYSNSEPMVLVPIEVMTPSKGVK
jgi:hypothetical protein